MIRGFLLGLGVGILLVIGVQEYARQVNHGRELEAELRRLRNEIR